MTSFTIAAPVPTVASPAFDTAGFASRERYSDDARAVLDALERRTSDVVRDVETLAGWRVLFDHTVPNDAVRAMLREIFLAVCQYQPHTTEASMLWLGRLPKSEHRLMRSLVMHKAEEAEHGEWARRDYLALGGDPARLDAPPTPATFAISALWWRMAVAEDPFGYLGAEYLFEYLTARVCQLALPVFEARQMPADGMGFLLEHATEDIKHTNLISHHILDVVTRHPDAGPAMLRCFDYFRHAYPMPVWGEAMERALADVRA